MSNPVGTMSNVLKNASASQEADAAAIFANILNSDQHAMKALKGTTKYEPEDAARLARIMAEYNGMVVVGKTTTPFAPRQPAATGAAAAV